MILFNRYSVTEFLLTTVNIHTKLILIEELVNRTVGDCCKYRNLAGRAAALRASARSAAVIPSDKPCSGQKIKGRRRWKSSGLCQGKCRSKRTRKSCRGSTAIW